MKLTLFLQHAQQTLENVPLFNLISLLLAIVGIILAYYFYYKSIKYRAPVYAVRSINIIKDNIGKINDLKISYAGSDVKNLSIARVAFWNFGKETISSEDVAPLSPIKIVGLGSTNFLNVEIIYEKNNVNNFIISPVADPKDSKKHLQNEFKINFDYFDQNEGVVFQVFHTGKTGDEIKIEGVVKGSRPINKISKPIFSKIPSLSPYFEKLKRKHKKMIMATFLVVVPLFLLVTEMVPKSNIEKTLLARYIPIGIVFLLYWSMAVSIMRRRVPSGFDIFDEELKS